MHLKKLEDTENLSQNISKIIKPGDVIFLYGEKGTGKTTFTRFLINYFERKNRIKNSEVLSPTFNIVYDYDVKSHKIMHYDLYRLKSEIEIKELGIFEDSQKTVKIIEWPELIKANIKNKLEINFFYSDKVDARNIKISGIGKWKNFKIN